MGSCISKESSSTTPQTGAHGSTRQSPAKVPAKRTGAKKASSTTALQTSEATNSVIQSLFAQMGTEVTFQKGERLLAEGEIGDKMFLITSGQVDLLLESGGEATHLAKRGEGEILGELSFLLGNKVSSSAVAEGPLKALQVNHTEMLEKLSLEPMQAGQLFNMVAILLSRRVSELSSKMRLNVVKAQAPAKASGHLPAADAARARSAFDLPPGEKLLSMYHCSVRREVNAVKEEKSHFGEVFIFSSVLAFELKMFAFHKQLLVPMVEVIALLKAGEDTVQVELKGQSIEMQIPDGFEEAVQIMEAARVQAQANVAEASLKKQSSASSMKGLEKLSIDDFEEEAISMLQVPDKNEGHALVQLALQDDDWVALMTVAKQRTYKKGEYLLMENSPTCTLFQVVRGQLRVELCLKESTRSVVVGYRSAGEMLGETSLLTSGRATASVAAEIETTVLAIDGRDLEKLFHSSPQLPSRFFCFLASYQAERLFKGTQALAEISRSGVGPKVTIPMSARIPIEQVIGNEAYCGIFAKYIDSAALEGTVTPELQFTFDFYNAMVEFAMLPDAKALAAGAAKLEHVFLDGKAKESRGSKPPEMKWVTPEMKKEIKAAIRKLEAEVKSSPKGISALRMLVQSTGRARRIFAAAKSAALEKLKADAFEGFLGSAHYNYILELKAKEGVVPLLQDFKVLRVLGQGGFGQVIEVVKRDCGCGYAMKVMEKAKMKSSLGSSWRRKIASEQQIMATLNHPFLVNLKYAFQNSEFLILVMDLVISGDLSEFVLTRRRLTPEQVHWVLMEVVEVFTYVHSQDILYRDLKPENLLIDDEGHIRLIDMGLAAKITKALPERNSRVGTDCYMAPEVRWAKKHRKTYGKSADWYTVGVLLYEFTHGDLPFSSRDTEMPVYRGGNFPSAECKSLCEGLMAQVPEHRIGNKGPSEIKEHPYFGDVDWDIVSACMLPSPCKGIKGVPKRKKDKEMLAQRTAGDIAQVDMADEGKEREKSEYNIDSWDFVSPLVVTEEYMESLYHCVSSI